MARSREVRKLDQNRATSSTDSGVMVRLGVLTRNRLVVTHESRVVHRLRLRGPEGEQARKNAGKPACPICR